MHDLWYVGYYYHLLVGYTRIPPLQAASHTFQEPILELLWILPKIFQETLQLKNVSQEPTVFFLTLWAYTWHFTITMLTRNFHRNWLTDVFPFDLRVPPIFLNVLVWMEPTMKGGLSFMRGLFKCWNEIALISRKEYVMCNMSKYLVVLV